ncbi:hypothetical protein [Escherichia phage FP43]|jgi:hypothetical protein|uniref:Transcription modulator under heat shock n=1 Tax=Escherichia phage FP43 TaxID=2666261 RepID=A0A650EZ00_9CAUD|nr:hypothetical protein [Escherichia phage FP43]
MDAMLFKMYLLEAKSFKHIPVEDKTPLEIAILINKSLNNPQYIVEEFCKLQIPKGYKIRVERVGAITRSKNSPFSLEEGIKDLGYESTENAVYVNPEKRLDLFEKRDHKYFAKKYFITSLADLVHLQRAIWKFFKTKGVALETFSEPVSFYLGE